MALPTRRVLILVSNTERFGTLAGLRATKSQALDIAQAVTFSLHTVLQWKLGQDIPLTYSFAGCSERCRLG